MATAGSKRYLGINVLEAARQRIAWVFDTFPKIYVSFSGGKDSTVMLHLVMEEAKRRNRRVAIDGQVGGWASCAGDGVRKQVGHIEREWRGYAVLNVLA